MPFLKKILDVVAWMGFCLNISDMSFAKKIKIVEIVFILFDGDIKEIELFIFIFEFVGILICRILTV